MGQGNSANSNISDRDRRKGQITTNAQRLLPESFQDLKEFPPEIALSILSNLNATDLCLASCVWQDLAEDDLLWRG